VEGIWTDGLGDPAVRDKHVVIIGPLGHCLIGNTFGFQKGELAHFYAAEAEGVVVSAELASEMFKGQTNGHIRSRIGRLNFFLMSNFGGEAPRGTPGNYWVSLSDWPKLTEWNMYMLPSMWPGQPSLGELSNATSPATAAMSYTYDPTTKDGLTPMLGGNNLPIVGKITHCGSSDLMKLMMRTDVLVFDSGILEENLPVVGKIRATLFVSSSAKDTDFVVTVSDLGKKKAMLVRYGAVRMRWRHGGTGNYMKPNEPLVNGTVYEVDIDLQHTAYVFPKGHRVRVSISSAAYPYYDANPNTGSPESKGIAPSKFEPVPAKNAIHMGPQFPSKISLPVVKIDDIPHNPKFRPTIPPLTEASLIV
jgi:putative CocE/NonD family hydrolase